MENGKVIPLGERLHTHHTSERAKPEHDQHQHSQYPASAEIPKEKGLEIAAAVVQLYSDPQTLLNTFVKNEISSRFASGSNDPIEEMEEEALKEKMKEDMKETLEADRISAGTKTDEELAHAIARHSTDPDHYDGTMILGYAEEFIHRFGTGQKK